MQPSQVRQRAPLTFNNPHDPPGYVPRNILKEKEDPFSRHVKNSNKSSFEKFVRTKYSNYLMSSVTVLAACHMFYKNFLTEESSKISFSESVFRWFVFLQMLIRYLRIIYFNRPQHVQNPLDNLKPQQHAEKLSYQDADNEESGQTQTYHSIKNSLSNYIKYCSLCKINIVEKDHHCWFLSCCISKKFNHAVGF